MKNKLLHNIILKWIILIFLACMFLGCEILNEDDICGKTHIEAEPNGLGMGTDRYLVFQHFNSTAGGSYTTTIKGFSIFIRILYKINVVFS